MALPIWDEITNHEKWQGLTFKQKRRIFQAYKRKMGRHDAWKGLTGQEKFNVTRGMEEAAGFYQEEEKPGFFDEITAWENIKKFYPAVVKGLEIQKPTIEKKPLPIPGPTTFPLDTGVLPISPRVIEQAPISQASQPMQQFGAISPQEMAEIDKVSAGIPYKKPIPGPVVQEGPLPSPQVAQAIPSPETSALATIPYLTLRALRGLTHPLFAPLAGTGIDTNKLIEEAIQYWGERTPEMGAIPDIGLGPGGLERRETPVKELVGGTAEAAGAIAGPVKAAFKAGSLVTELPQIMARARPFYRSIMRGMIAGSLVGEGDPEQTLQDMALFGIFEPIAYGIGKVPEVPGMIRDSATWRRMKVKERGLILQSLDDTIQKNPNITEAEILRQWNNPQWRKEALERRIIPEEGELPIEAAAPEIVKPKIKPTEVKVTGEKGILKEKIKATDEAARIEKERIAKEYEAAKVEVIEPEAPKPIPTAEPKPSEVIPPKKPIPVPVEVKVEEVGVPIPVEEKKPPTVEETLQEVIDQPIRNIFDARNTFVAKVRQKLGLSDEQTHELFLRQEYIDSLPKIDQAFKDGEDIVAMADRFADLLADKIRGLGRKEIEPAKPIPEAEVKEPYKKRLKEYVEDYGANWEKVKVRLDAGEKVEYGILSGLEGNRTRNAVKTHWQDTAKAISEGKITSHPDYPELGREKPFDRDKALKDAIAWKYLTTKATEGMTAKEQVRHGKKTTKGDLDKWLMDRYGIDETTARDISNAAIEQGGYKVDRGKAIWEGPGKEPVFEDYPELGKVEEPPVKVEPEPPEIEVKAKEAERKAREKRLKFAASQKHLVPWIAASGGVNEVELAGEVNDIIYTLKAGKKVLRKGVMKGFKNKTTGRTLDVIVRDAREAGFDVKDTDNLLELIEKDLKSAGIGDIKGRVGKITVEPTTEEEFTEGIIENAREELRREGLSDQEVERTIEEGRDIARTTTDEKEEGTYQELKTFFKEAPFELKPTKKILTLNLKKEYWDAIKAGDKKLEYRLYNDFWKKRLEGQEYDEIHLKLGYPKKGDTAKTIILPWEGYNTETIQHKEFGPDPVQVFSIKLGEEIREPLELKPTEPTPEEKIAIGKERGEIVAPEKEKKKAVIPTEKIPVATKGEQVSLLPKKKGEQITLEEKIEEKKPIPAKKVEPEIPPRPLVNPKATYLQQDKQLRKQQAWDKKYGKIEPKPIPAKKVERREIPSIPDKEKQLGEKINEKIGDITPPVGLSLKKIGKEPIPSKESKFTFSDKQIEARFKEAQGIKGEPFWDRLVDTIVSLKNKATREYEHLPKTKEYAQLRFDLLRLSKQRGVASDRTLRGIQGITINLNKRDYDLFTRKVILDDLMEVALEDKPLPFGFTKETVAAELARLDKAIAGNKAINEAIKDRNDLWDVIKSDYIAAMKAVGFDVSEKLTRKNYFRHQILEYVNAKGLFGTGKRLRVPTKRGFLKKRVGSELDINTDYIQSEHEVMAQMIYDIEVANTIRMVNKNYNIIDKLKKQAKELNDPDITWQDLIPEGYTAWRPREGNIFYLADSIPAKLAEQLLNGELEEVGITADDIRKTLAIGGKYRQFVIKNEIAETLDNLVAQRAQNVIAVGHKKLIRSWKIWQLISPRRFFKYNFRNLTGDADGAFAGNPGGFKKTPQAVNDLYEIFVGDKAMTGNLKDWFERGGVASTLQAQEMGQLNELRMFKDFLDKNKKKKFTDIPMKSWKAYWRTARMSTDFRESILRYANYLHYLEQMEASPEGLPKNYGASIPEEIKGLADIKDRAFWLSNDLLGAYDRVSVLGHALREHLYPFWSWKEVNFKRYKQLFKNAAQDKHLSEAVGRKFIGTIATTPFKAYRIGKFMIKALAFWTALQVWNNTRFPDEEDDLPENIKNRPHIILGRNKETGEVEYFSRVGALPDLLEWFDLDAAPYYVDQWSRGRMDLKEIAKEMAKAPVNIMVQGGEPVMKMAGELITRRAIFPDVFAPRTIRDRGIHIARGLGLENEYKELAGKPSRPYKKSVFGFFAYKIDPLEAAYHDILSEKKRFLKKINKYGEGFWISPKGNALYNARLALRFKDQKAAIHYMAKYISLTGAQTAKDIKKALAGIDRSLDTMDPLSGLTTQEQNAFVLFLLGETEAAKITELVKTGVKPSISKELRESEEIQKLMKALLFYQQLRYPDVEGLEKIGPEKKGILGPREIKRKPSKIKPIPAPIVGVR